MGFAGWKRRCQLTISSSAADSDLSNKPWLFTEDNLPSEMFDADGSFPALDGGGDIRFSSDADGNTRLSLEVVNFEIDNDPANGKAELWVKIPTISNASGATVYVWYGKTGESQPARDASYGSEDVWSDDYRAVFHFNQDLSTENLNDSSPYENHGTPFNYSSSDLVDGLYGKAVNTDGASEGIIIPDATSLEPDSVSLQATLNLPIAQTSSSYPKIVHKGNDATSPYSSYGLQHQNSATAIAMIIGRSDGQRYSIASGLSTSTWMHVYGYCAEYARYTGIVINESVYDTDDHGSGTLLYDTYSAGVANSGNSQSFWEGNLEELRISGHARTLDSNETDYRTQFGIATYTSVGTPVSMGQYIEPTGIATAEALGTPVVFIEQFLGVNGITSEESLGTPTIIQEQFIEPTGIASAEDLGTPTVYLGQSITVPGIASEESFGTPNISFDQTITVLGIASAEDCGLPTIYFEQDLALPGITTEESLGAPTVTTNYYIYPIGIDGEEDFGDLQTHFTLYVPGISSSEQLGTPSVAVLGPTVYPTGINSEESLGIPSISLRLYIPGINSEESVGTPVVSPSGTTIIAVFGIDSQEALGLPTIGLIISGDFGIASEEALGIPSLSFRLYIPGISSEESCGAPTLTGGATVINVPGINSEESLGTPEIGLNIAVPGITSEEQVGTATLHLTIYVNGISSEEIVGVPILTTGGLQIVPVGIDSEEALGLPTVDYERLIDVPGIDSEEALGIPELGLNITVNGIPSEELLGSITVLPGTTFINPAGIASEEWLGFLTVSLEQYINVQGIDSAEQLGEPVLLWEQFVDVPGIASLESLGVIVVTNKILTDFEAMHLDDIDTVFLTDFAITGIYTHKASGVVIPDLVLIFDNEYTTIDPDTGAAISSSEPMIVVNTTKFTRKPLRGDHLDIRGFTYFVKEFQPDGTNTGILTLEKT